MAQMADWARSEGELSWLKWRVDRGDKVSWARSIGYSGWHIIIYEVIPQNNGYWNYQNKLGETSISLIPITFRVWEIWFTFAPSNTKSMEQTNPNLSTDFVKDMLAESPAREPKAVMADRIPKLPKNVHWAVKAVVEPYPEDRKELQ